MAAGLRAQLSNEGPAVETGGVGEKILKGVAEGGFVLDSLRAGLREGAMLFADEGMGG